MPASQEAPEGKRPALTQPSPRWLGQTDDYQARLDTQLELGKDGSEIPIEESLRPRPGPLRKESRVPLGLLLRSTYGGTRRKLG